MQNKLTNELMGFPNMEAMTKAIVGMSKEEKGPTFEVNEIVPIKGYLYRLKEIRTQFGGALLFIPYGPTKKGREKAERRLTSEEKKERKEERRTQRRERGEKR